MRKGLNEDVSRDDEEKKETRDECCMQLVLNISQHSTSAVLFNNFMRNLCRFHLGVFYGKTKNATRWPAAVTSLPMWTQYCSSKNERSISRCMME